MIAKIDFSIENCARGGETPLHKAGFVIQFLILAWLTQKRGFLQELIAARMKRVQFLSLIQ